MKWAKKQSGFTIVELLIVIVVIGILAAITIIGYGAVRNNANQSAAFAKLKTAQDAIKVASLNGTLPATLAAANYTVESGVTAEYWLFDGGNEYCLSITQKEQSAHVWSDQSGSPQAGKCSDAESLPVPGFLGLSETTTITTFPQVSGYDYILYAAVNIINNTTSWQTLASISPTTATSRIQLDTASAGTLDLRYRIDSSATSNMSSTQTGARTTGRHAGWVMIHSNATVREFAYDKAAAHASFAVPANTGFTFSGVAIGSTVSSQQPLGAIAFNAPHSQQERFRVLEWMAHKYSTPMPTN